MAARLPARFIAPAAASAPTPIWAWSSKAPSTITGQCTDEMLTNPSPNDWLMYRGNYSGWSYSQLGQINAGNVNQLQLKWTLAMNDGGTNETTPMVHDGIMYPIVVRQHGAGDQRRTGEVIWQNNIGPPPRQSGAGRRRAETRSMAFTMTRSSCRRCRARFMPWMPGPARWTGRPIISDPAKSGRRPAWQ